MFLLALLVFFLLELPLLLEGVFGFLSLFLLGFILLAGVTHFGSPFDDLHRIFGNAGFRRYGVGEICFSIQPNNLFCKLILIAPAQEEQAGRRVSMCEKVTEVRFRIDICHRTGTIC